VRLPEERRINKRLDDASLLAEKGTQKLMREKGVKDCVNGVEEAVVRIIQKKRDSEGGVTAKKKPLAEKGG